jgi:hypothetical protein
MAIDGISAVTEQPDGSSQWLAFQRTRGSAIRIEEGHVAAETALAESPLPRRTPLVLALPSHRMVMRVLELPSADESELAGMVELQIDKFSPFPLDQMAVGHEVLAVRPEGLAVLAAAARISAISEAGARFREAGLRINRVDALVLGRWRMLADGGHLAAEGRETLVLLEGEGIDLLTHEAGVPVAFSGLGEFAPPDSEAAAQDLAQEIEQLLMALEAERGREPLPSSQSGADPAAVCTWRPPCKADWGNRSWNGPWRMSDRPCMARPCARKACPRSEPRLNLTPSAWRDAERARGGRRRLLAIAAALLGGWIALAGLGWAALAWQRLQVQRLTAAEQRWIAPANAVRRLRTQVQMIRRYMDRRTSALECLREISLLQPQGVDLTSFTYRKGEDSNWWGRPIRERWSFNIISSSTTPRSSRPSKQGHAH